MKPCGKFNRPRRLFSHILLNQSISFIVADGSVTHKYVKLRIISKFGCKWIEPLAKFAMDRHGRQRDLTMRLRSQVSCPKMVETIDSFRKLIKFLVWKGLSPFMFVFLFLNWLRSKRYIFLLESQISLLLINTISIFNLNVSPI